jgi:hypothetical protein
LGFKDVSVDVSDVFGAGDVFADVPDVFGVTVGFAGQAVPASTSCVLAGAGPEPPAPPDTFAAMSAWRSARPAVGETS